MPLRGRLQSLFEEIDAKVDAKLGLSGGSQGYLNQHAMPYGTPNGQYGGPTYGQPGAQNGWPQQQNHFGGPGDQWHTAQQSGQLAVPQQQGRPRGNSNPAARERDNDGIPFDAPPAYEEASHPPSKQSNRPPSSTQYGNAPAESLPPRLPEHWAPTNPFNSARVAGSHPPQQYTQAPNPPAQQHQVPPQRNPNGTQPMFPPQFEMWFNTSSKSSKTELAIAGQPPNNPAYVATLSLGWKAKMELHQGGVAGPVIASGKSSNTDGTKQGLIFPDGSTVEVKTPDLSKFYFVVPVGPQGFPEKFRWKKSRGGDMREVSPIYSGWKLTRESDGEVMAVFGEKVGFKNGAGGGTFAFVGAARNGALGGNFTNVAVISFVKVTHTSFVSGIVSSVVGAV